MAYGDGYGAEPLSSDPYRVAPGDYFADPNPPAPAYPPAYGQPAYGQPAYGQPAYGQYAYGQPPYGPYAYGQPYYGNPYYGNPLSSVGGAAPTSHRTAWIVGGATVAFIAVLGLVLGLTTSSNGNSGGLTADQHSVRIPSQSGEYTLMTGSTTDRLLDSARSTLEAEGWNTQDVKIALYSRGSSSEPGLVFLGGRLSDLPAQASTKPSIIVDQILIGNGAADADAVSTGALGGVARCGNDQAVCAWADSSTFGNLAYLDATTSEAKTAAVQFRKDAEQ